MGNRVDRAHIDQALTAYTHQLPVEQGMIQDFVCPILPVAKETDKFWKFNREELKTHQVHRADGAPSHELQFDYSSDTYACEEYALSAFVTRRELDNADAEIRPKMEATEKIVRNLRIARERRVAALVQSTSNWNSYTTPSTKWDASGADPESDVLAAKQAFFLQSGAHPNVAVINDLVRDALIQWIRSQPGGLSLGDFRAMDRVFGNAVPGPEPALAGLFGIPNWFVGMQLYDSGGIGASESLARIWGSHCTLLYVEPSPGMKKSTALYTFENRGMQVKGWEEPARDGEYVECSHIVDEKIISTYLGYHLTTCLS